VATEHKGTRTFVPYFHVVFTVPTPIAAIALQNKAVVYDILLKTAAETIRVIGADSKHLGGETGMIAILHTGGRQRIHLRSRTDDVTYCNIIGLQAREGFRRGKRASRSERSRSGSHVDRLG
jgi:hypothetical protein